MASKTESTQRKGSSSGKRSSGGGGSSWGAGANAGVLLGAAVAGAAVGLAANAGRKLFVQFSGAAAGDWFDALRAEHKATLAIFDRIEATGNDQGNARSHLLAKLKYALTRHAHQEEAVVYPAAGSLTSSVRVAPERLAGLVARGWVDVCTVADRG